jgi:hypothetical protein
MKKLSLVELSSFNSKTEDINMIVETPRGNRNKFDFDVKSTSSSSSLRFFPSVNRKPKPVKECRFVTTVCMCCGQQVPGQLALTDNGILIVGSLHKPPLSFSLS